MSEAPPIENIELKEKDLRRLLDRIRELVDSKDYLLIEQLSESNRLLLELINKKRMSISKLRRMIFGSRSEKARNLRSSRTGKESKKTPKEKPKGHGRNGGQDFPGAQKISVPHQEYAQGNPCPACEEGTLHKQKKPGVIIRMLGQPFVQVTIYNLEKLRCGLCGKVFTAKAPEEAGAEKRDASVGSMISLLHYGAGVPFHRIEKLQRDFGMPLAASTQWEIGEEVADLVKPAFDQLLNHAAQGYLIHNDDTAMKILSLLKDKELKPADKEKSIEESARSRKRTGIFTTGVISQDGGHSIALFFTGPNHAGENLNGLLKKRLVNLPPPIQMCDGLSRNLPKPIKTMLANCLTHGRRGFVDVYDNFPDECAYVIEKLGQVYKNDELAKGRDMSAGQRLLFHQNKSGPIMDALHKWMKAQLNEKKVEPNSGLGMAINYMLKRWDPLTLFLREPGVPLDNNICERALKMAILHRKNSLFYKTQNGARVGDMFMSLIHTCRLCGANPFEYITQLQNNAQRLLGDPERWMPWNYCQTLLSLETN
jgi:transposase